MSAESELKEWQDYFGCDSPHDTNVMDGTALGNEQMRNNILENKSAKQSVHLTTLRRWLTVSILFNLVLFIAFAVIVGGR